MLIKGFRGLFERLGYRVIPAWRLPFYTESEFMRSVLKKYAIELVLDVGANLGQYRDYLRAHCEYDGEIISFEPNPDVVAQIMERVEADPKWQLVPCALGSEQGSLTLNLMSSSSFSSFRQPAAVDFSHLNELNTVVGTAEVPVCRLDALDTVRMQGKRTFLKLDTQGFDLEVLRGAQGVLSDVVGVQTEASVVPIYDRMPSFPETLEAFRACGFSLANAAPVTRDPGLRAIEFDLIFINDSYAAPHCRHALE